MRIVKKTLAMCLAVSISFSINAFADMSDGFARTRNAYGDKAEKYILKVDYEAEQVNEIHCIGEDASVYTETNVRTNPSAEVPAVTTIGKEAKVKVTAFTDNGWCRVWVKDTDGTDYYGFIKGDLLNPTDWKPSSSNTDEAIQAETEPEATNGEDGAE